MRIIAISDTHEKEEEVICPDGDALIFAGDATFTGKFQAMSNFINWFKSQPHKYKVLIFGNHERLKENQTYSKIVNMIKDSGIIYLEDSVVEIEGIKFYGSPYTPLFGSWAWMLPRGKPMADKWSKIPNDVEVLICHGPPYGILDKVGFQNVGCQDLANRIQDLKKLRLFCCGHIHCGAGSTEINGVKFVNAAQCDEEYNITNNPIVIDL